MNDVLEYVFRVLSLSHVALGGKLSWSVVWDNCHGQLINVWVSCPDIDPILSEPFLVRVGLN